MENIGRNIAELRKGKGWSQKQLAELLGVSNKTVSKWENGGGCPDISILPALARALEVTIDELFNGVNASGDVASKTDVAVSETAIDGEETCHENDVYDSNSDALTGDTAENTAEPNVCAGVVVGPKPFREFVKDKPQIIVAGVLLAVTLVLFVMSFFGVSSYSYTYDEREDKSVSTTLTAVEQIDYAVHFYSQSEEESKAVVNDFNENYVKEHGYGFIFVESEYEEYLSKSLHVQIENAIANREFIMQGNYYNVQVPIFYLYDTTVVLGRLIISFLAFLFTLIWFCAVCRGKDAKIHRYLPYVIGLLLMINVIACVMPNPFEKITTADGTTAYGMAPAAELIASVALAAAVAAVAIVAQAVKTAKSVPSKSEKKFYVSVAAALALVFIMSGLAPTADIRASMFASKSNISGQNYALNWGLYDLTDAMRGWGIVSEEYDEDTYASGAEYLSSRYRKLNEAYVATYDTAVTFRRPTDSIELNAEDYVKPFDAFRFSFNDDEFMSGSAKNTALQALISNFAHLILLWLFVFLGAMLTASLMDGQRRKRLPVLAGFVLAFVICALVCDSIIAANLELLEERTAYMHDISPGEKPLVWAISAIPIFALLTSVIPRKRKRLVISHEEYDELSDLIKSVKPGVEKI